MATITLMADRRMLDKASLAQDRIVDLNLHALTVIQDLSVDPHVAGIHFGLQEEMREVLLGLSREKIIRLSRSGYSFVQVRPCLVSAANFGAADWAGRGLLRSLANDEGGLSLEGVE